MKRKNILAVFAHPDDESFAVGGTLAKLAEDYDIYLICATDGNDPGKEEELGEIRRSELAAAAKILSIKEIFYLDYQDGTLCNSVYHQLADKIQTIADKIKPFRLITFEHCGGSGHLDHVAVSMVSSFVYERTKYIEEIWYYCISRAFTDQMDDYFIYFPDGKTSEEVDLVVDVADVWETKVAAMKAHQSQLSDVKSILEKQRGLPREEYFLVDKR